MQSLSSTTRRTLPRGFSLIEILMVLAILLLLMGIAYVTLAKSGENARIASTRTTITLLNATLLADYQAMLQDFAEQERKKEKKAEWGNLLAGRAAAQASYPTATAAQADALVRHNRYIGLFPQRWQDMFGYDGVAGGTLTAFGVTLGDDAWSGDSPTYKRLVAGAGKLEVPLNATALGTTLSSATATNVNAEILYLLLTGGENGRLLLDQINPRHIGDTDADGLPEFLDDWGQPIRFYNTPTSLFSTTGNSAVRTAFFPEVTVNTAARDPLDSLNVLLGSPFDDGGGAAAMLVQPSQSLVYHHLNVYYAPLLVSAGPDESLGLIEPDGVVGSDRSTLLAVPVTGSDEALDNITNYQGAN